MTMSIMVVRGRHCNSISRKQALGTRAQQNAHQTMCIFDVIHNCFLLGGNGKVHVKDIRFCIYFNCKYIQRSQCQFTDMSRCCFNSRIGCPTIFNAKQPCEQLNDYSVSVSVLRIDVSCTCKFLLACIRSMDSHPKIRRRRMLYLRVVLNDRVHCHSDPSPLLTLLRRGTTALFQPPHNGT